MRKSQDYARYVQLCGRSPIIRKIMRPHYRIIPLSLSAIMNVNATDWEPVVIATTLSRHEWSRNEHETRTFDACLSRCCNSLISNSSQTTNAINHLKRYATCIGLTITLTASRRRNPMVSGINFYSQLAISIRIADINWFCVFIIRLSFGHLQVLRAFVSCSTLYCALYLFLVLLRTNKWSIDRLIDITI